MADENTLPAGTAPAVPAQAATPPIVVPSSTPATPPAPVVQTPEPKPATNDPAMFGAPITYQPTGNTNLDTALQWAGSLGLNIDSTPEMKAAASGNFGPLKALLAAKQIPGSDAYIALAESGYNDRQAATVAKEEVVQATVVAAAGSPEQWSEVFEWAGANAEPAEKEQINYALEQGGILAEAMAALLVANYRQVNNVSVPPSASPVIPTAIARPSTSQSGPLSPAEYSREVANLRHSLKGRQIEGTREYAALQSRRMAYRSQ